MLADGELHQEITFAEYHDAWNASLAVPHASDVSIRQVGGERIRQPSSLCTFGNTTGTRPAIAELLVGPLDAVSAPEAARTRIRVVVDIATTHSFLTEEAIARLGLPPAADAALRIDTPTAAADVERHEASWETVDGVVLPAPMLVGCIPAWRNDAKGIAGFDILRHILFEYDGRTGKAVLSGRPEKEPD